MVYRNVHQRLVFREMLRHLSATIEMMGELREISTWDEELISQLGYPDQLLISVSDELGDIWSMYDSSFDFPAPSPPPDEDLPDAD